MPTATKSPVSTLSKNPHFKDLMPVDRCDRCGAQAYIQAVKGEQDLLFCGHHGQSHAIILEANGWEINDQTFKINEKAGASA